MKHNQTIVKSVFCMLLSVILMISHAAKALPPCPENNNEWHMCVGTYESEWVRGGEFTGEWRSGRPYKGTETYRSGRQAGEKYVGIFKKGKPHGYGKYFNSDGSTHEGEFRHGLPNGEGRYTNAKGEKKDGVWKSGLFIKSQKFISLEEQSALEKEKASRAIETKVNTKEVKPQITKPLKKEKSLSSLNLKRIQSALKSQGFYRGIPDGISGPGTLRAIEGWQNANGYSESGVLSDQQVIEILQSHKPDLAIEHKASENSSAGSSVETVKDSEISGDSSSDWGVVLFVLGIIGFCLSAIFYPGEDKRTKTGYKNNAEGNGCLVVGFISVIIGIIGLIIL